MVEGLAEAVGGTAQLDPEASNYATRVHRLAVGDEFTAIDPVAGVEADARIVALGKRVAVELGAPTPGARRGFAGLELVQALGKGDKLERVLRDCVVFGAAALVIVESKRSVARVGERADTKRERWTAIAADSARQCLRSNLPELHGPLDVAAALARPAHTRLVLHPTSDAPALLDALLDQRKTEPRIGLDAGQLLQLWIGPEGGFSTEELAQLLAGGALPCHLGELVLRTETAATAVLAIAGAVLAAAH